MTSGDSNSLTTTERVPHLLSGVKRYGKKSRGRETRKPRATSKWRINGNKLEVRESLLLGLGRRVRKLEEMEDYPLGSLKASYLAIASSSCGKKGSVSLRVSSGRYNPGNDQDWPLKGGKE